jgi:hypothetical protein
MCFYCYQIFPDSGFDLMPPIRVPKFVPNPLQISHGADHTAAAPLVVPCCLPLHRYDQCTWEKAEDVGDFRQDVDRFRARLPIAASAPQKARDSPCQSPSRRERCMRREEKHFSEEKWTPLAGKRAPRFEAQKPRPLRPAALSPRQTDRQTDGLPIAPLPSATVPRSDRPPAHVCCAVLCCAGPRPPWRVLC